MDKPTPVGNLFEITGGKLELRVLSDSRFFIEIEQVSS